MEVWTASYLMLEHSGLPPNPSPEADGSLGVSWGFLVHFVPICSPGRSQSEGQVWQLYAQHPVETVMSHVPWTGSIITIQTDSGNF